MGCKNCTCEKSECGNCNSDTCLCKKRAKILAKLELNPQDEVAFYDGNIYTTKQLIQEIKNRTPVGEEFVKNYLI